MKKEFKFDEYDVNAIRAVAKGVASSGQQKRAIEFIINLSDLRRMPQVFENTGDQYFDAGKRFIGWHIARIIELVGVTKQPEENKKEPE